MPEVRGGVYGERWRTETKGCGRDAGVLGLVIFSDRRGFMAEDFAGGVVAQLVGKKNSKARC